MLDDARRQLAVDRKKAVALGVLLLVLLIAVGRLLLSGGGAEPTEAGVTVIPATTAAAPETLTRPTPAAVVGAVARAGGAVAPRQAGTAVDSNAVAMGWSGTVRAVSVAGMPRTLARDLFTTQSWHKFSVFTPTTQPVEDQQSEVEGPGWFKRFGWKLAEIQRTQEQAREQFGEELAELELRSTMTGTHKTAYISGPGFDRLVREGDVVRGFSVVRIEDRRVTFEKSGVTASLMMQ